MKARALLAHGLLAGLLGFVLGTCLQAQAKPQRTTREIEALNKQYCGGCHLLPPADLMPKKDWPRVIQAMQDLTMERDGRPFFPDDVLRDLTAFYYESAPDELPRLPYYDDTDSPVAFHLKEIGEKSVLPSVINIRTADLNSDDEPGFLLCDGESNQVNLLQQVEGEWRESKLADVAIPVNTEVVDYDAYGDRDILVAALGYYPPSDKLAGRVVVLEQTMARQFEKKVLLEGVGRITDVRSADMDRDGDLDIAVAIFGGNVVGELAWLENRGKGRYQKHTMVNARGGLNMTPTDLNGDDLVDFISFVSQENEAIVGIVNLGGGEFKSSTLTQAPHPMFGSTGMCLADLDSDGDQDIVFTNGDNFDLQWDPKPYHGVQWLENFGRLKLTEAAGAGSGGEVFYALKYQEIGRFYGAVDAVVGDMDGDGDMDIVASSWSNYWDDPRRQSLVWFENDGSQSFRRHNIASRPQSIVSLELRDVNNDKRLDIVGGVFRVDLLMNVLKDPEKGLGKETDPKTRVVVFENRPAD
ncbi:MAG: VCBS repeat-containing protein [Gemmatimonadetes bacterium]|nr:VCBS repeat-containing protein [Gemmatimonadota bacterium]